MPGYLQVRAERRAGLCVLRVTGELDLITAEELAGRAAAAVQYSDNPVLVDLAGLSFIDVAGARALDAVTRAMPAGRLAGVRSCQPQVRRVLDLLGLALLGLALPTAAPENSTATGSGEAVTGSGELEVRTRELVSRVREARLHASVAKYDASGLVAALTDTGRRVERTRTRSIRTRQQGRLLRASIRAARKQDTGPTASAPA